MQKQCLFMKDFMKDKPQENKDKITIRFLTFFI